MIERGHFKSSENDSARSFKIVRRPTGEPLSEPTPLFPEEDNEVTLEQTATEFLRDTLTRFIF